MGVLLSLITAASYGTADFLGGMSAKRISVIRVVAGSQVIGLVGVALAALLIDNTFTWRDFGIGALGGAAGGMGVGLLYRGLSRGPMSLVAPLTAVSSAVLPSMYGIVTGDRFTMLGWAGLAVALVAIWLVAGTESDADVSVTPRVVVEALLAGSGFGLFFILLDTTASEAAPWPIVGARVFTSTLLIAALIVRRQPVLPRERDALGLVAATGIVDTGSNVLFLYALRWGDLTTVSVLSSFYPGSTVLLARVFLGERSTRLQLLGVVLAIAATAAIAAG
ncbi:MAG: DMT family transporter [Actinomycetota bacterium]